MGTTRKLVLYIAQSLDGYIATENESLDWLFKCEGNGDNGYGSFYEKIDTILLGRRTYDWILRNEETGFPYKGKECYVFSRNLRGRAEGVEFVNKDIVNFTRELKKKPGKDIWVVGGGDILNPLMGEELVDEFIIHIAPTIIGQGIPLFKSGDYEISLELVSITQYNQFVELHYKRK
jgi:dihydrofolate reductase